MKRRSFPARQRGDHAQHGFTILELLLAITIVGLVMAVAVPASIRSYESMQYRQAVRDVITAFASARYGAINTGRSQDVLVDPRTKILQFNGRETQLPGGYSVAVHAAGELSRDRSGVIRFYPEGGSSGGGVDLEREDGRGVRITVDWLVGRVSQETYVAN
jgi:general secretion pathway protein H